MWGRLRPHGMNIKPWLCAASVRNVLKLPRTARLGKEEWWQGICRSPCALCDDKTAFSFALLTSSNKMEASLLDSDEEMSSPSWTSLLWSDVVDWEKELRGGEPTGSG